MGFKLNNYIPLNKWYWIYFLSVGISVFIYGKYRCEYKDNVDYLAAQPISGIDGWIISHVVAFAIAGVLFPDTFYTTMILGILWELFEMYLGITKPDILDGVTNCGTEKSEIKYKGVNLKSPSGQNEGYWWYGKKEDVLADAIGFLVGKYIILKYLL